MMMTRENMMDEVINAGNSISLGELENNLGIEV